MHREKTGFERLDENSVGFNFALGKTAQNGVRGVFYRRQL